MLFAKNGTDTTSSARNFEAGGPGGLPASSLSGHPRTPVCGWPLALSCITERYRCVSQLIAVPWPNHAKRNRLVSLSPQETVMPQRWWTLVVLSASLLVIGLDNTILNVALPTLRDDLGASSSQLQWIVDAYMLVFAGLLLTAGALGDRFGRKRALASASPSSASAPVFLRWPPRPTMLIATRALMGVGGAFIMPSTLSIITAVFPAEERAEGDRRVGRRVRPRHRHRPGRGRLADRARELECRLPRQPAVRRSRAARRPLARPRVQGSRPPRGSTSPASPCRSPA